MRNAVQHLDNEIANLAVTNTPTWGSLSWVHFADEKATSGTLCVFISGPPVAREHAVINPIGRETELPIGLLTLEAHGLKICFREILSPLSRALSDLEASLEKGVGDRPRSPSDAFLRVHVSFVDE